MAQLDTAANVKLLPLLFSSFPDRQLCSKVALIVQAGLILQYLSIATAVEPRFKIQIFASSSHSGDRDLLRLWLMELRYQSSSTSRPDRTREVAVLRSVQNQAFSSSPSNDTNLAMGFILLGFPSLSPPIQLLLCSLLSVCYAFTLAGNLCIVWAVLRDSRLTHLPMYILLGNFSGLETCYVTTTAPRMLSDLASPLPGVISFHSCFLQFYFFFSMGTTESFLLAAMALDRYLAICQPLRYPMLMSPRFCCILAASCWICGFLWFLVPIALISQLHFCGSNTLDHFICDPGPLLASSCTLAPGPEMAFYSLSSIAIFGPFIFIVCSYMVVLRAVMRLPSAAGRRKAFSTCTSHMAVVSLFYGSIMVTYVVPEASGGSNKVVTLFYSVVTPMLNPLIYSLRNKEMKDALKRTVLQGNWGL
ncbi:olfactory receptor 11G2-like [Elgaria multicarinata webbii]|uniref:olfactory receptor 11G2-like n=1 Tax=Elgaria multicarinata webbii TaxID=159646 RepID=UPI002FCD1FDF